MSKMAQQRVVRPCRALRDQRRNRRTKCGGRVTSLPAGRGRGIVGRERRRESVIPFTNEVVHRRRDPNDIRNDSQREWRGKCSAQVYEVVGPALDGVHQLIQTRADDWLSIDLDSATIERQRTGALEATLGFPFRAQHLRAERIANW